MLEGDAVALRSGGVEEAFDGFGDGFAAEVEGGVVDGHYEAGAGMFGHFPGLFRGAVVGNPGVVGADGHEGEFGPAEALEGVSHGGIAGVEDAAAPGFDEEAIVAAPGVGAHPGAPVFHFEATDGEGADADGFVPANLLDAGVAVDAEEVGGATGGDDFEVLALHGAEGGDVEMVHVGVGEEDGIDAGDLVERECGFDDALKAEGEGAKIDADAGGEDGVGDDGKAFNLQENGGMAEPGGVDAGIGPAVGGRLGGGGVDGLAEFPGVLLPEHGGLAIGGGGGEAGEAETGAGQPGAPLHLA